MKEFYHNMKNISTNKQLVDKIRTQEQLGGEKDRGKDIKNLYEIILASTNRMDNLCTGQDNDRFWTDYISRSEISCNGYETA